ncbi:Hypothetical protein GLP15_1368 [Giardia lamblia P15]|uniref:Uncharacterized protein n=1 Tax=Giardia intestinalis (strain P15) TaxID=658858 RepID=E1EZB9_GIAIA|nr:Hypothetical protein GLP15_1368 [Giardia lamblia P15]
MATIGRWHRPILYSREISWKKRTRGPPCLPPLRYRLSCRMPAGAPLRELFRTLPEVHLPPTRSSSSRCRHRAGQRACRPLCRASCPLHQNTVPKLADSGEQAPSAAARSTGHSRAAGVFLMSIDAASSPASTTQTLAVAETQPLVLAPRPQVPRSQGMSPAFRQLLIDLFLQVVVSCFFISMAITCLCVTIPALHARPYP